MFYKEAYEINRVGNERLFIILRNVFVSVALTQIGGEYCIGI